MTALRFPVLATLFALLAALAFASPLTVVAAEPPPPPAAEPGPAMPAPATPEAAAPAPAAPEAAAPATCAPAAECCCGPSVDYRAHRVCRKVCCGCAAPMEATLDVQDPCCCGRVVPVTVCLPACCEGCPAVSSRCGLFGRGIVTYDWCCGYKVRVVFDRRGDVTVHTYGS
jgi:hypothetical protein